MFDITDLESFLADRLETEEDGVEEAKDFSDRQNSLLMLANGTVTWLELRERELGECLISHTG